MRAVTYPYCFWCGILFLAFEAIDKCPHCGRPLTWIEPGDKPCEASGKQD